MRYNIILWDTDDTLLDFQAAERYGFERTMKEAGLPFDEDSHRLYRFHNDGLWEELNKGQVTKDFLVVERFRRFLKDIHSDVDPVRMNRAYLNNLSQCSVMMPEALETVRALAEAGAEQYIITNAVSFVNRRRVGNSPLAPFIRETFVSEDIGYAKPDVRYYEQVFRRIPGFAKAKTLAVGDSLSSDIRGGNNAGIDTCYYNPKGKSRAGKADCGVKPTYEAERLSRITALVCGTEK